MKRPPSAQTAYVLARSVPAPNGCRLWARSTGSHGYGNAWDGERNTTAPRLAFEAVHGPVPPGLHILHSCNEKLCVEVAHLRTGTRHDNMMDLQKAWGHRKLTPEQVAEVRTGSASLRVLSKRLGVAKSSLHAVRRGQTYRVV